MNLRQIIIPPARHLFEIYSKYKDSVMGTHIWEGIYPHYKDVPVSGPGFDGDLWVNSTKNMIRTVLNETNKGKLVFNDRVASNHDLLSFLVGLLFCKNPRVNILDFGGGMGISYLHLLNSITNSSGINYTVMENKLVCEGGKEIFSEDPKIKFYDSFHSEIKNANVVYINSALQYVEDYHDIIKKLISYNPSFFLFANFSAGDNPTYATMQKNVRGSRIAYWFINVNEIIDLLSQFGYSLTFKSRLGRYYNQNNFPEKYRLKYACNLLFCKV